MRRRFRNRGRARDVVLVAILALTGGRCNAQYWPTAMEKIDTIAKAGIYRIVLLPSFVARCRTDLSDLRIFDEDDKEAPYVLRAGAPDRLNAGLLPLPDPKILQRDSSDRHSYYWLQYDDDYRIDRLSFVISGPGLYKRTAVVSPVDDQLREMPAVTITIDPVDSVFQLRPMRASRLLIDVANHDNSPLAISRVASAQSGIYLLTWLEPQHEYRLMAGDLNVAAPDYDLHYFTDSMPATPATVGLGPLIRIHTGVTKRRVPLSPRLRMRGKPGLVVVWSLVVVIMLFLLYLSVKLARTIDKKGKL